MPTYEYACRECGEHLEVVQSFKDDALTDCPACDREGTLRKVFSAAGIIFKGSGWHIKDYSAAKSPAAGTDAAATSGESGSGKGEGKGAGKGETKGASKGESKGASKGGTSTSSGSGTGGSEAKSA